MPIASARWRRLSFTLPSKPEYVWTMYQRFSIVSSAGAHRPNTLKSRSIPVWSARSTTNEVRGADHDEDDHDDRRVADLFLSRPGRFLQLRPDLLEEGRQALPLLGQPLHVRPYGSPCG